MEDVIKILHLEDDEMDVELIKDLLFKDKINFEIINISSKDEFVKNLYYNNFDIILADYSLPSFNGLKALSISKKINPFIPFIIVSGVIGEEAAIASLKSGATDYVLKSQLKRLGPSILRAVKEYDEVRKRKYAEEEVKKSLEKLRNIFNEIVVSFSSLAEKRDPYTAGHQRNVASIACSIAKEMNISDNMVEGIKIAGLLHDIGKIYVPAEILIKPIKLGELEFNILKTHSQVGYDILKNIEFPWPVADMVLQHHERMNGSGYPNGLKENMILLESRIIAVADIIEAMSSHRPYRAALGIDKALEEISSNKGRLYDIDVSECCISLFKNKKYNLDKLIKSL